MGKTPCSYSCSSSIDSSSNSYYPSLSNDKFDETGRRDLSTDLRLGLSLSPSSKDASSTSKQREVRSDWPPIKPHLRSTLAEKAESKRSGCSPSLFVKVYMEGIPIGRKLDLLAHNGYPSLVATLTYMFNTTLLCPGGDDRYHSDKYHVLTYEDKEGDWMMVGDVPWELFLNSVKRLKITRADRC